MHSNTAETVNSRSYYHGKYGGSYPVAVVVGTDVWYPVVGGAGGVLSSGVIWWRGYAVVVIVYLGFGSIATAILVTPP